MTRVLLLSAGVPAIALSFWLMRVAEAPMSAQVLQAVVAGVAAITSLVVMRMPKVGVWRDGHWLLLAVALALFAPLLTDARGGPERWIVLGSFRLYVAPVVLPLALWRLDATLRTRALSTMSGALVIAVAAALVLQPDAAQLTAFTAAMIVIVTSRARLRRGAVVVAVLVCSAAVAWWRPDPLAPVRYVEGVFTMAANVSPLALLAALAAAALPVVAFVRVARVQRSRGAFAVALYYATLFALAPLQVTPVPLLGFGTGPILGYFLVAGVTSRRRVHA